MALSVAVQMDPIESIDIAGDSTFALMLEAEHPAIAEMAPDEGAGARVRIDEADAQFLSLAGRCGYRQGQDACGRQRGPFRGVHEVLPIAARAA